MTLLVAAVESVAVVRVAVVLVLEVGALQHLHPVDLVHVDGHRLGLRLLDAHQLLGVKDEAIVASQLNGLQLASDEGAALGVVGVGEDAGLLAELSEHLLVADLVLMGHLGEGGADAESGENEEQLHNFSCWVVFQELIHFVGRKRKERCD